MMDVAKQSNSSDCGILSIAYAFDLCSGNDLCEVRYDHKNIRQHLVMYLLSRFPLLCKQKSSSMKSSKTVCSCRMPGEMAECDSCQVWYHRHSMDIPSEVFNKERTFIGSARPVALSILLLLRVYQ